MQLRPILVSAACSAAAALALVISEGAMSGVHVPHAAGGGNAAVPKTESGNGTNGTFDNGPNSSGAFGGDPTGVGSDSSSDQQPAEQPASGQSDSSAIDPLATAHQLLPKASPIPVTR